MCLVNMKYFVFLAIFAAVGFGFPNFIVYERTPLGDSIDKASMKILKESFHNAKDKNVIASPLGALTLLSMFSAGAEGKIKEEIMKLLGSTHYKQLEKSYGGLMEKFTSIDPSYLVLANKMYVSNKYTLEDQFSDVVTQKYKSEIEQVDFGQKTITANSINAWAENRTKGYIKSPVNEQTIDEAAAAVLFNVIFFQGHWHVPFIASETVEKDFYVDESNTVKKPTMMLRDSLFYHQDKEIGFRMVELPYKEDCFRMIVVLPDKKDGLAKVIQKLAQKGILDHVFALRPAGQVVAFEMPKFEVKNSLDLKDILPKVGVSRMFSKGARKVVRDHPVTVSKAFQEAFFKVDEKGATAGAFTGLIVEPKSLISEPPPPLPFKVDHPFLFAILHEDIVLFTGTYTH